MTSQFKLLEKRSESNETEIRARTLHSCMHAYIAYAYASQAQ